MGAALRSFPVLFLLNLCHCLSRSRTSLCNKIFTLIFVAVLGDRICANGCSKAIGVKRAAHVTIVIAG